MPGELAKEVGPAQGDVVVRVVDAGTLGQGLDVVGPVLGDTARYHELNARGVVEEDGVDRGLVDRAAYRDDAVAHQEEPGPVADRFRDRAAQIGGHDQVARLGEARHVRRHEVAALVRDRAEWYAERGEHRRGLW